MSSLHDHSEMRPASHAPALDKTGDGHALTAAGAIGFLDVPPMLYQPAYAWSIFLSALDIMLTWFILARSGVEVNPVAREVIHAWGLPGAIAFKFALVILAIVICEVVGRRRPRTGWSLSATAAFINAIPVGWAIVLVASNWDHFTSATSLPL